MKELEENWKKFIDLICNDPRDLEEILELPIELGRKETIEFADIIIDNPKMFPKIFKGRKAGFFKKKLFKYGIRIWTFFRGT